MVDSKPSVAKLRVFISYSRDDLDFADQLDAALELYGFETTLDRHEITGGEEWRGRLANLIRAADTVVFVMSPSSAGSPVCGWEVDEAVRLGKRIIPVVCRPLDGAQPPQQLANLDYIFFYAEPKSAGSGFGTGQVRLVTALNTDLDWLREHTRLFLRASEWETAERLAYRMLSGDDIVAAKAWVARKPANAPEPTALHLAFIQASENWEAEQQSERQRRLEERERLIREAEADRKAREEALSASEAALKQTARLWRRQAWGGAIAVLVLGAGGWWGYDVVAERRAIAREAARDDIRGQIIAYATAQDEWTADQAPGLLTSPYTTSLVDKLRQRNKSISEALVDAHQRVNDLSVATNMPQRPFLSTSLNGHIYLWQQAAHRRKHVLIVAAPDIGAGQQLVLAGPPHDAAAFTKVLNEAGFNQAEITRLDNPTRAAIADAISSIGATFKRTASGEDHWRGGKGDPLLVPVGITPVAPPPNRNSLLILFFTGHGASINAENYILTNIEGANTNRPEQVKEKAVGVRWLTQTVDAAAAASIIILDTHFPAIDRSAAR